MNQCHSNFFFKHADFVPSSLCFHSILFIVPWCHSFSCVRYMCLCVVNALRSWSGAGGVCILDCIAYGTYLAECGCEAKVCEINGNPQMPVHWKPHYVQAPKEGRPCGARDTILQILWKPHCPSQVNHGIQCQHTVVCFKIKIFWQRCFFFYPQKAEIIKIWEGGWQAISWESQTRLSTLFPFNLWLCLLGNSTLNFSISWKG